MKRTLVAFCLLTALIVGCSSVRKVSRSLTRPVRSLFAPKVDPHSSPEILMTEYREYARAGQSGKIWSLYSDELRKKNPNGLFILQDELRRDPISDVHIGNPVVISDGRILYFNIVTVESGDSRLQRVALLEENSKWFIESIGSEVE